MRGRILLGAASTCLLFGLWIGTATAQSQGQILTKHGDTWEDASEGQTSWQSPGDALEPQADWSDDSGESCLDGNCDLQSNGACVGSRPYGLAAGVEATYLRPSFNDANTGLGPSNYDREAGARIWLQYQGPSGWGIRARYWDFNSQQSTFGVSASDDTIGAQNFAEHLDVYAVDLELTRAFVINKTTGWFSVGARTGRLQRSINQQLTIFDLAGGGGDDATVISQQVSRGMQGTGITTGIDLLRPLGESRFSAVCNLRGSVLWGTNELDIRTRVIEVLPVGVGDLDLNDDQQLNLRGSNLPGMWIGELQAGLQWNTPLSASLGGGNAFVRVLYEAQWWNLPGVTVPMGPSQTVQNFLFQGITAAVGFTR